MIYRLDAFRAWCVRQPWWPERKVLNGYVTTGLIFVATHLGFGVDAPLLVYGVPVVAGAAVSWLSRPGAADLHRRWVSRNPTIPPGD